MCGKSFGDQSQKMYGELNSGTVFVKIAVWKVLTAIWKEDNEIYRNFFIKTKTV